jgi:chemotaxis protein MotB
MPPRLGAWLALSLALHAGLSGLAWLGGRASVPGADDTTVVELISAAPDSAQTGAVAEAPGSPPLVQTGRTPPDAPADPAAAQESDVAAGAEAAVVALEAEREELRGRVDSLSSVNADLTARLEAEAARAADLERRLQEAREAEETRLARVRSDYDELVTALQGEIADKVIALHQANQRLTVTIVDRVLFPSGQATLTPEGRRTMARVGKVLARAQDRRILIEGHTDDVPIGPALRERFSSNWELSAARATEVVRYLSSEAGVPSDHLSAAGRAATRPVASNDSEEGRSRNRRIEIILLPLDDSRAGAPSS